jgi:hypothetical protein
MKPFYKSRTLLFIAIGTVIGTAKPIGEMIEKKQFNPSNIGAMISLVLTNGLAAYYRVKADQPLGLKNPSNTDTQ